MGLVQGFDAAYPPLKTPPGCAVAGGYIGGNTPHIWTQSEWNRFVPDCFLLPIWTGYRDSDPIADAANATRHAVALGWQANAIHRRVIALDFENEVNGAWIAAFAKALLGQGFLTMPYVSLSAVAGDPAEWGYWLPDWNSAAELPVGSGQIVGWQHAGSVPADGGQVDLSVFDDTILSHLGRGPRI